MDWNRGYLVDSGYTYEYFFETNPTHLRFLACLENHYLPDINFRYLELGCGQGFNLICMAALNPSSEFVGIDFYPEHIAHARSLASKANINNVHFIEGDFVDLSLNPEQLGLFHYVVAHGITTWISAETRDHLFQLAGKVMHPGGAMYNSYNCFPGWLPVTPFQRLVIEYQKYFGGVEAQNKAMDTLKEMKKTKSLLFKMLPDLSSRLDGLSSKSIDYLLQEYNHPVWQPVYSSDMLRIASSYKLDYLGSANLPFAFTKSYPNHQNKLFASQPDVMLRECVKDIACNVQFRRDVYVKGSNPLWKKDAEQSLLNQHVIFRLFDISAIPGFEVSDSNQCSFSLGNGNVIKISKDEIQAVVSCCHDSKCQIRDIIRRSGLSFSNAIYIICLLLSNGSLAYAPLSAEFDQCHSLNSAILDSCISGAPYSYLLYPDFSTAGQMATHSMLVASQFNKVSQENDLLSLFVDAAQSIGLRLNGVLLSGNKLSKFGEESISLFNQKYLPPLLRSQAFSSNP